MPWTVSFQALGAYGLVRVAIAASTMMALVIETLPALDAGKSTVSLTTVDDINPALP